MTTPSVQITAPTHPATRRGSPRRTSENTATWTTSVFDNTVPIAKSRASKARIRKTVPTIWARPAAAIVGQKRASIDGISSPAARQTTTAASESGAPYR